MNRLFIHAFLYQTLTILSRIGITYLAVDIGLDATHVGLISGARCRYARRSACR